MQLSVSHPGNDIVVCVCVYCLRKLTVKKLSYVPVGRAINCAVGIIYVLVL